MHDLHLHQTADSSTVQYSNKIYGIGPRYGTASVSLKLHSYDNMRQDMQLSADVLYTRGHGDDEGSCYK